MDVFNDKISKCRNVVFVTEYLYNIYCLTNVILCLTLYSNVIGDRT